MNNKQTRIENLTQTRIENLTLALYKRDREVREACNLMLDLCDMLAVAQDALRATQGATPRDEERKCVVEERISMAVERCQKFRGEYTSPF